MRSIYRIGIGFLVGLFFAAGYTARTISMERERAAAEALRQRPVSAPGVSIASTRLVGGDIDLQPLETMWEVLRHLREHYVEPISPPKEGEMTYDSLKAMLASLDDPNTRFLEPAQRKLVTDAAEGKYHGIGAVLGIKRVQSGKIMEEHLIVIAPLEGGPADQAGLKPGDDIVKIDGRDVLPLQPYQRAEEMVKEERTKNSLELRKDLEAERKRIENGIGIFDAEDLLASDPGENEKKEVELTVIRQGSTKELTLKVVRQPFSPIPVESSTFENGTVGYIKVNCIARNTAEKLADALKNLQSESVKGLVLDLRNLAGGETDSILKIAEPFLSGKIMAIEMKSRGRREQIRVPAASAGEQWTKPVVVLVNSWTARLPEILAAALKENAGAKLVGEKTYGDLSAITIIDLVDGSAVAMTTGAFLTGKGGNYNGKGIPVDVEVASAKDDPQLKTALRLAAKGGRG